MVDTADEFCRAEVELLTEYSSRCSGAELDSWRLLLDADFICGNAGEAEQNGRLSFSADDAQAITRAPISLPSSTAARPTPPAAPSTASVSPARNCARSFSA